MALSATETTGEGAVARREAAQVPRVALEHVSFSYGAVPAVDDLSLSAAAGEIVCLLGPSGCGKSTTLRIAAGLERQQQGKVFIGGREVAGPSTFVPPEKRGVGLMFQDYALFPHMTVAGNVAFGLSGLPRRERAAVALETLRAVGMEEYAEAYPHMLSGGEQQRVALARALAPRPLVILMDEPFSGLDRRLRDDVRDETAAILAQSDAAALIVTHDPEEAMSLADRIIVMRNGRVVQDGTPDDLYFHPIDAGVAEFFSNINRLHGHVAQGAVATPLGAFAVPGMAEGAGVEILIRPDQVHFAPAGTAGSATAKIDRVSPCGRERLLQLSLNDSDIHLSAQVPITECPQLSAQIGVQVDLSCALIFPCRCAADRGHDC